MIPLLICANGLLVDGPVVRLNPGMYSIVKEGKCDSYKLKVDDDEVELFDGLVVKNHVNVQLIVTNATNFTMRLVKNGLKLS